MRPHDELRADALAILADLVAFDTTSSRSNLALVAHVAEFFRSRGHAVSLTHDEAGQKANILATVGPLDRPGLLLSGHTDVVPVEGQAWTSDPFVLTRRGNRVFGRGSADMKGFIACAMALTDRFAATVAAGGPPVHFALSYDEEVGCLGVPGLMADCGARIAPPLMAIVGEPSVMGVVNAHKGVRLFDTFITGRECHSSDPRQGASASVAAARLAVFLDDLADETRLATSTLPSAALFDPGWSSINVGVIQSGVARNIVARDGLVSWELRLLPDDDPDHVPGRVDDVLRNVIIPAMRKTATEAHFETVMICDVPGLRPEDNGLAETMALRIAASNKASTIPYGSDAGIIQASGLSTVICGPGDIAQAHKPDEFIDIDQLDQCIVFLGRLHAQLSA